MPNNVDCTLVYTIPTFTGVLNSVVVSVASNVAVTNNNAGQPNPPPSVSQSGSQMNVTQGSDKAILQWNSFNIGSAASVNFRTPCCWRSSARCWRASTSSGAWAATSSAAWHRP